MSETRPEVAPLSSPLPSRGRPLKVLLVLEYFWPQVGGVETLFLDLAAGLAAQGHQVTVLTTRLPGTLQAETHQGIEIRRIGNPERPSRYAFSLMATPLAIRLARKADLIHTTTYNAALPAWIAGKVTGRPVVITVHELIGATWHALPGVSWPEAAAFRMLELACVRLPFARSVAVSRATRNALRQAGVPDQRLSVVYNGVNLQGWAAEPEVVERVRAEHRSGNSPLVTFYGRPGVTKGVEVLIGAFAVLLQTRPDAKLLLILGQYPQGRRAMLEALAKQTLGPAVQVLASVPRRELPSYLAASDCVAVPSLTEGFGFSAAEAALLGVPVVASDAGSLPEVLSGRFLLVAPGDAQALAAGLLRALSGELDSTPPRPFPASEMVSGYEEMYRRVLPTPTTADTGHSSVTPKQAALEGSA
jgi:D-inositol-3-phosphate glycosyltransferase